MRNVKNKIFLKTFLLIIFSFSVNIFAQSNLNNDSGKAFLSERKEISSKKLGDNKLLIAFTQDGSIQTKNILSPYYNASLFAHGSILKDSVGNILKEVVFYETIDADGDLTWSVIWYPNSNSEEGEIEIIQGTGKWAGISGIGKISNRTSKRADGYQTPEFEIEWGIDETNPPFSEIIEGKDNYEYMDKCLSFHGPHKYLFSKDLSNGISLDFSTQSGVLMSMLGFDTMSPRNGATCFDRGTTVKKNGKVLGDVMILEDTDADGDIVWLYHIWWYNKGPGMYNFIGGTGKWKGIEGVGVTRGMFKKRTDDHFMLKSELYWNIK